MTREGEIVVLQEHLATCERLAATLMKVRGRIGNLIPMSADRLRALDDDAHVDVLAFLKTYEQFEDTLGRTLKTIAMLMQFGKTERMQPRDVAYRAVALGIIEDGKAWADAVRVRNELAHEYPLNPGKQAEQIAKAWEKSATLFDTARVIRDFVERERLLHGDL
ncbi:hypothetical protein [uncultured Sphingomonas sp.]|uniref:hypothetical protein n=1 Tax=uncultured Sphingomonas sp. TaxID=158754 RepID=UPI0035CB3A94